MRIKLHGIFAKEFGDEHFIEANTVAEAIEGLTRQVGFYDHLMLADRPTCRVLGFDREEDFYLETELEEIHIVPAMIGGGAVGRILIGTALIIAGVLALPNVAIGGALIGAGIGMILGGVMSFFVKAPTISKDNDPEASKYLGLGENTVTIGTPIPIQFGRGPANGHILALNVDSSDMVFGTFPANPT